MTEQPVAAHTLSHEQSPRLSFAKVSLMGLAVQQVVPSMALAGGYMLLYSGNASWLSMLTAGLSAFCIVVAVNVFASRFVESGSLMSYGEIALGSVGRRIVASAYLPGFIVALAAVNTTVVIFSVSALEGLGWAAAASPWSQAAQSVLFASVAGGIALRGLDTSVAVSAVLTLAGLPVVLWATGAAISAHGLDLQSQVTLQGSTFEGFVSGVVVALAYFVGIDSLAALAAETENPKRNVPRLLFVILAVTGTAYVLMIMIQVPVLGAHADDIVAGVSPTTAMAEAGGVAFLSRPTDVLMIGGTFATLLAFMNAASRVFARAAADGLLPRNLATYAGVGSRGVLVPTRAIMALTLSTALVPCILQLVASAPPMESSTYLYTLFSYFWVPCYALLGVAALRFLRRQGQLTPLASVLIGIGVAAFLFLLIYNILNSAGGVLGILPWVMLAVMSVGFIGLCWSEMRRRAARSTRAAHASSSGSGRA